MVSECFFGMIGMLYIECEMMQLKSACPPCFVRADDLMTLLEVVIDQRVATMSLML